MTFDQREYAKRQEHQRAEVTKTLRAMPEFTGALDQYGRGPAIMLLCPRDHRFLLVIVRDQAGPWEGLEVQALNGHRARNSGPVASPAEPWRHGMAVCPRPGCPELIDVDGMCEEHGRDAEWIGNVQIGNVRTRFSCRAPKCTFSQAVTAARLLQLYGLALKLGRTDIPIGDTRE